MKVTIAGYNLDSEIISELAARSAWSEDNLTPETLSAAYARISRDPADIGELRKISRSAVEKARRSNETIIFGLGHASVAEHAVFNFDLCGISRLATEEIQRFRLASFTEKSQRYITLNGDFVVPPELAGSPLAEKLQRLISEQNEAYFSLFESLKGYFFKKNPDQLSTKRGTETLEGYAKEDARYLVSLATSTQFGMTVNARTLENMLRYFAASNLAEVREIGKSLFELVHPLSPSIVKYVEPTPYDTTRKSALKEIVDTHASQIKNEAEAHAVKLVSYSQDPDKLLFATLIYANSEVDLESALAYADKIDERSKKALIDASLASKQAFDKVDRAFENIDLTFELTLSATNFAQLKRHRISTQIVQDYTPLLGVTVPESIRSIREEKKFMEVVEKSEELYRELEKKAPVVKNYALTNAHRRRVLFKLNLRELYHFISLRSDAHAQWDIRKTADEMQRLVKGIAPYSTALLLGKSEL